MKIKTFMAAIFIFFAFCSEIFSITATIGVKGGYFIWEPYIQEIQGWEDAKKGDGVLYGPLAGIGITDDFSVSASLLMGTQKAQWYNNNYYDPYGSTDVYKSTTSYVQMKRRDIDSALSYKIMRGLSIFAGYKYYYAEFFKRSTLRVYVPAAPGNNQVVNENMEFETKHHGPGFGAGYHQSIGKFLHVSLNLSALYMTGTFKMKKTESVTYMANDFGTAHYYTSDPKSFDVKMYGFNIEPSTGIFLRSYNLAVNLGIRYQVMRIKSYETEEERIPEGWVNDHIYGVFISILYFI